MWCVAGNLRSAASLWLRRTPPSGAAEPGAGGPGGPRAQAPAAPPVPPQTPRPAPPARAGAEPPEGLESPPGGRPPCRAPAPCAPPPGRQPATCPRGRQEATCPARNAGAPAAGGGGAGQGRAGPGAPRREVAAGEGGEGEPAPSSRSPAPPLRPAGAPRGPDRVSHFPRFGPAAGTTRELRGEGPGGPGTVGEAGGGAEPCRTRAARALPFPAAPPPPTSPPARRRGQAGTSPHTPSPLPAALGPRWGAGGLISRGAGVGRAPGSESHTLLAQSRAARARSPS